MRLVHHTSMDGWGRAPTPPLDALRAAFLDERRYAQANTTGYVHLSSVFENECDAYTTSMDGHETTFDENIAYSAHHQLGQLHQPLVAKTVGASDGWPRHVRIGMKWSAAMPCTMYGTVKERNPPLLFCHRTVAQDLHTAIL